MNYPLISEYIEAIKAAEDNFDQLKHLRPVLDDDGLPVMTSGNFAVVFKMKDEQIGKLYAVKCFTKEQEGRAEAYKLITEELATVDSPYILSIKYLEKELFVDTEQTDETEFPVLLMDWVEGKTLDKYLRENLDDKYALEMLAYRFSQLAQWLIPQPFAHGDLKPDNILVCEDGTLVLVDYDGMYVPAMRGQKARELGSPDFRHPSRTEDDFDEHIDDFPLISILFSLKAISLKPQLLEKYGAQDRLLLSENDYRDLSRSEILDVLKTLIQDAELAVIVSLFIIASSQNNLSLVSVSLINASKPIKFQNENDSLSTKVTDEDLSNAWTDEYGVTYSADGKRLLKAPASIKEYVIKEGTIVICDWAFSECMFINRYYLERTIINSAVNFYFINYRSMLSSIKIPQSVTHIGVGAFGNCSKLLYLSIPDSVIFIGDGAFHNCRALSHVNIPTNLSRISRWLFLDCESLKDIILPYSVKSIGDGAFCNCSSFVINQLPNSITEIGKFAFKGCFGKLKKIYIPDAILEGNPFAGCRCKIEFDNNNRYKAYEESNGFSSILSTDGKVLIHCAYVDGETTLGFNEFNGGYEEGPYLVNNPYIFPEGIETIGYAAFASSQIGIIHIPYGVRKIENYAFYNDLITEVSLPPTINFIGKHVFNKDVISKIIIPKGSFAKFEKLLPDYKGWIVEDR